MMKQIVTASIVLVIAAVESTASDTLVPPPPAPHVPSQAVPHPSIPLSAPASIADPGLPNPYTTSAENAAEKASPAGEDVVPPASVISPIPPAVPTEPVTPAPVAAPNAVTPNQGYGNGYLYQPAPGTVPFSQSQYNTFSVTGEPVFSHSFSPYVGIHDRYPYYSYRRPWYTPGPASRNVNIIW